MLRKNIGAWLTVSKGYIEAQFVGLSHVEVRRQASGEHPCRMHDGENLDESGWKNRPALHKPHSHAQPSVITIG